MGADSTTTYGDRHYNNSQKLFQIGENSTLGVITWGLGGLLVRSHRTLFAELDDDLRVNPPPDMQTVATRWAALYWQAYSDPNSPVAPFISRVRALASQPPHDPGNPSPPPNSRSEAEEVELSNLQVALVAGFCIAGYVLPKREPEAFEIMVDPLMAAAPVPRQYGHGYWLWGAPKMFQRLIHGCDNELKAQIMTSGHWTGSLQDLNALIANQALDHPATVPIRDAIDFIHASISSTIKAFKFSSLAPICGGPIEIAVITTDRNFRWVRHKPWDAGITEGDAYV
ncbi:hypothetical protein XI07_13180 [Bradyrhizobium sp. CCBAU 11445]|nr:hypothetical protein [Bradyrhizobium sp. CCBAU 11445]